MKPILAVAIILPLIAGGASAQELYNSVPDVLATSAALEQYKEDADAESSGSEKEAIRHAHSDCLKRATNLYTQGSDAKRLAVHRCDRAQQAKLRAMQER